MVRFAKSRPGEGSVTIPEESVAEVECVFPLRLEWNMLVQFGHEFGVVSMIKVPVYDQCSVWTLCHLLSADQSMKFLECGVLVCVQWNVNSGEMRCFPHDTPPPVFFCESAVS